jgi:hypothetical protein
LKKPQTGKGDYVYDKRIKPHTRARQYHNSNRVKFPQFEEGKIPFFRIGALLILTNRVIFLSCTLNLGVVEFFRFK